ncbi:MAG TPA: hypothetical protein VJ809_11925 [Pirellulales bacterium]|nr:hypothetical protein [Pirellulales bacterium]
MVRLTLGRPVARLGDRLTKEAVAVARGWMLNRGDSVCLTDAGRDVVRQG